MRLTVACARLYNRLFRPAPNFIVSGQDIRVDWFQRRSVLVPEWWKRSLPSKEPENP